MLKSLLPLLVTTTLLLSACDRDEAASNPPDAPMGYDSRAAAGDQPAEKRPADDARAAAAEAGEDLPQGTIVLAEVDRQFLTEAIQHNDLKLKLAEMARKKAQSDSVQQYAQRVLDEQLQTNTQLRLLATRLNVDLKTAPPGAGDQPGRAAEPFEQLSGQEFDQAYARHEIESHQRMLQRYQRAAGEVKNAEVLDFINRATEQLQSHLQDAQRMIDPGNTSPS